MTDTAEVTAESVAEMSPEQAEAEINRLSADGDFRSRLLDRNIHNHDDSARKLWSALHAQAHGTGAEDNSEQEEQPGSDNRAHDQRVPENPEGYHVEIPHTLAELVGPEGVAELDADARKYAHALGMSNLDLTGLLSLAQTEIKLGLDPDRVEAAGHKSEQRLRAEWGDQYDARISRAVNFMRSKADDGFREFMDTTGLSNNENAIRLIERLAQKAGY